MIPIIALIVGFGVGWRRAARRGGVSADKWQFGIAHGVGFALLAFIITLALVRLGLMPPTPF